MTARSCTGSRRSTWRKLRTLKTDANPLLFKINMAAGHGGSLMGRFNAMKEEAFVTRVPARPARGRSR